MRVENIVKTQRGLFFSVSSPFGDVNILLSKQANNLKVDVSCTLGKSNLLIEAEKIKEIVQYLNGIL